MRLAVAARRFSVASLSSLLLTLLLPVPGSAEEVVRRVGNVTFRVDVTQAFPGGVVVVRLSSRGRLGAAWEVRLASEVGSPAVLDLPGHGRIVVVDDAEPWLPGLEARFETEPRRAVFAAVDLLAEVVGLTPDERGRLLGPLAREALLEAQA